MRTGPPSVGDSDEHGFSLPELLVVVMVLAIVAAALAGTMASLAGSAARTDRRARTTAESRTALEVVARDLRAANPIEAIASTSPTSVYDFKVSFGVFCSSGASCVNNVRRVEYSVEDGKLVQRIGSTSKVLLGPSGTPTLQRSMRRNAILNSSSEPAFVYYDRSGARINTSTTVGSGRPSTYFRDCAKRVEIRLLVRSSPNDTSAVVELTTGVTLRNHNEVNPC